MTIRDINMFAAPIEGPAHRRADTATQGGSTRPGSDPHVGAHRPGDGAATIALLLAIAAPALSRWSTPAAALTMIGVVFGVVAAIYRQRLRVEAALCLGYVAYLSVAGLIVGSLLWSDVAFWSGEGRSLIAIVSVGIIGVMPMGSRAVDRCLVAVIAIGIMTGILALVYATAEPVWLTQPQTQFTGLTSSHHVQGAICSFLGGLLLVRRLNGQCSPHRTFETFALIGFGLGLWLAFSRVSLLATAVGLVIVLSVRGRDRAGSARAGSPLEFRSFFRAGGAMAIGLALLFLSPVASALSIPNPLQPDAEVASEARAYNAENRFDLWQAFIPQVARSPLVGVGPWRVNDDSPEWIRPLPLVEMAIGTTGEGDDFSTHNVIIQVLADAGIIGLAWFCGLLALIMRRGLRGRPITALSVSFVVWAALMQGLTGNSLLTTAVALPFSAALALSLNLAENEDSLHGDEFGSMGMTSN